MQVQEDKDTMQEFKEDMIRRFWRFKGLRFAADDPRFEEARPRELRPPVFREADAEGNLLIDRAHGKRAAAVDRDDPRAQASPLVPEHVKLAGSDPDCVWLARRRPGRKVWVLRECLRHRGWSLNPATEEIEDYRILAIGDIHGCSTALRALIDAINPGSDDLMVPLGDFIDRGPDSRGVIEQLLTLFLLYLVHARRNLFPRNYLRFLLFLASPNRADIETTT